MVTVISILIIVLIAGLALRGFLKQGQLLKDGVNVEAVPSRVQSRSVSRQRRNPHTVRKGRIDQYFAVFSYTVAGESFEASSGPKESFADAQVLLDTPGVQVRYIVSSPADAMVVAPDSPLYS